MWTGSTVSQNDEWIELYNNTDTAVDIGGWVLTHSATGGTDLTIPAASIVAPHGYFLISNYAANDSHSILDVAPDWVTSSVSLSNTCSVIELGPIVSGGVAPHDRMGCDGGDYFFATQSNQPGVKKSLERNILLADGLGKSSWHVSVGSANLDSSAVGTNFATPKQVNDTTAPDTSVATVIDTNGTFSTDQDWAANTNVLTASWNGFIDEQSGIESYEVSYGTDQITPIAPWTNVGLVTNTSLYGLTLLENQTYYFFVRAYNGVGLHADLTSDGITINTTAPDPATALTATDTPDDNGGSVTVDWSPSASTDVVEYKLGYRPSGTLDPFTFLSAGLDNTLVVEGLENDPQIYDFLVQAVDFSNLSSDSTVVTGSARDNLAPIVSAEKLVLQQNKPGNQDMLGGNTGATNEPATISIFDRDPVLPGAILINSVVGLPDGSFPALSIGDNLYGQVFLQAVDTTGNASQVSVIGNDIVGPSASTLSRLEAVCQSETCRVTIDWQNSDPDVSYYRAIYKDGAGEQVTSDLFSTKLVLDLPAKYSYSFHIVSYDQFGNPSGLSNGFETVLTPSVTTLIVWENGQTVVTTTGSEGAVVNSATPSQTASQGLIASAQAAEPSSEATTPDSDEEEKSVEQQDWVRIFVVVALLLVVGGSFYALSRSVGKDAIEPPLLPIEEEKPAAKPKKPAGRRIKPTRRKRKTR